MHKVSIKSFKKGVLVFFLFTLYLLSLSFVYSEVISVIYSSMNKIDFGDIIYWIKIVSISFLFSIAIPYKLTRPSDIILLVVALFLFIPICFISDYLIFDSNDFWIIKFAIIFFFIYLVVCSYISNHLKPCGKMKSFYFYKGNVVKLLSIITVMTGVVVMLKGWSIFDLSMNEYWVRRLSARSIFPSGNILSYVINIVNSALVLFLTSFGIVYKKKKFLIFAFLYVIVDWGVFGTKVTFILFLLSTFFLLFIMKRKEISLSIALLPLLLLFSISTIEFYIYKTSLIADLSVRRMVIVPAEISQAFSSYIAQYGATYYTDSVMSIILGYSTSSITNTVGDIYFNKPNMNANTNLVVMEIARLGVVGIAISSIVVGYLLILLNNLFSRRNNPMYMCLALLFSVRITEQALATILISSGVLFFIIFIYLVDRRSIAH